ncbi:MAG: hypothetical protein OXG55_17690 [bacterium]|nr:hypothetical protein [bacterium]MCY4105066.1 hypothetical protein [bacterium]
MGKLAIGLLALFRRISLLVGRLLGRTEEEDVAARRVRVRATERPRPRLVKLAGLPKAAQRTIAPGARSGL